MGKLYTLKEAANYLNVKEADLYRLDKILNPIIEKRGSKMKTRLYQEDKLIEYKKQKPVIKRRDKGKPRKPYRVRDPKLHKYNSLERNLWGMFQIGVKTRNLKNELTIDEYLKLIQNDCVYCGEPPKQKSNTYYTMFANGVDRIDNDLGYVGGNCVTACALCNRIKYTLSGAEFLNHIRRILNHVTLTPLNLDGVR